MAVEVTVKQMALTRDTGPGGFMERVTALLAKGAGIVLTEPGATPYHPLRAAYAQRVLSSPALAATMAGPIAVMAAGVASATTYDEVTKIATCTVTDTVLQAQVAAGWNVLAGIDTSS